MPKISVYLPLSHYLEQQVSAGKSLVKLSFNEIENLIKGELPPTARNNRNWWANSYNEKSRQCSAWLDYNWIKEDVKLKEEYVVFRYKT
ncbi:hypothetical protein SAMN05518871_102411 [Psychrobacillus sp. OK028]|uniref:DUF7662 domain-containing protein n=1 Tax=Psychrobacillus sp. OK028 TaxID=1884359 RepID=UPI000888F540|nr:hypothetical protein [Psychrobacillus sp. OK028]SDM85851.1 hypothetical protein SAMN05518871_102411 [Psychrobacillus sp. OK028]